MADKPILSALPARSDDWVERMRERDAVDAAILVDEAAQHSTVDAAATNAFLDGLEGPTEADLVMTEVEQKMDATELGYDLLAQAIEARAGAEELGVAYEGPSLGLGISPYED